MDKEEVTHLERMIDLHKKNLYALEEMLAKYGPDQPLHLINSLTMEREAIVRYTRQVEGLTSTHKELRANPLSLAGLILAAGLMTALGAYQIITTLRQ